MNVRGGAARWCGALTVVAFASGLGAQSCTTNSADALGLDAGADADGALVDVGSIDDGASDADAAAADTGPLCQPQRADAFACTNHLFYVLDAGDMTVFTGTVQAVRENTLECDGPGVVEVGRRPLPRRGVEIVLSDGPTTITSSFYVPGFQAAMLTVGSELALARRYTCGDLTGECWAALALSDADGPIVAVMEDVGVNAFRIRRGEGECAGDCYWRAEALASFDGGAEVSIPTGQTRRLGNYDVTNVVYGGRTESEECGGFSEYGIEPFIAGALRVGP